MKIKIKEDLSSSGYDFKKDQIVPLPGSPGPEKQLLQNLLDMKFAEVIAEPKAKAEKSGE